MNINYNMPANKAPTSKSSALNQLITESNWNLLLRNGHVDNTRSASDQGYEVVDEVKYLFGGSTKRRRESSAAGLVRGNENINEDTKTIHTTASKQTASKACTLEMGAGPSSTSSTSSGKPNMWKTQWSEEEIEELVRLRCQGMTYPAIANDPKYLPIRDLKALQLKFAKLKKISPYKERWTEFEDGKEKNAKYYNGSKGNEEDGDEDDEEED